ncbi:MAG: hypothetical protein NVS9B15_06690 [Acidobacteriaceae bacterium]
MNSKTIAIAAALYFAIFLLAHHTPPTPARQMFSGVHDLSTAYAPGKARNSSVTAVIAPEGSTVDRITPDRFVAPLIVIGNSQPQHTIDLNDIALFEQKHGTIPAGALVAFQTNAPVSDGTIAFLAQARRAYGVSADGSRNTQALATARHNGLYTISNIQDLGSMPNTGAVVVVAPSKIENAASAPARIYTLLR